jgi:hypothetical protein
MIEGFLFGLGFAGAVAIYIGIAEAWEKYKYMKASRDEWKSSAERWREKCQEK